MLVRIFYPWHIHSKERWSLWTLRPTSSAALRVMELDVCLCIWVLSMCCFLTSLSSVGLDILTRFPWGPQNIQDNTSYTGWMVTSSMTLSWNFPITRLVEDRGQTHDKREGWLVCGRRETRKDQDTWVTLSHATGPAMLGWGLLLSNMFYLNLSFDIWKFYLMRSVLRNHFWGLPDILMCTTP